MSRARIATRRYLPVLCVALLVGCGASDNGSEATTATSATDPSAKQSFLAAGDAICTDAQLEAAELARRAQELQTQSSTLPQSEQLDRAADLWGDQIEFAERFREQLGDLDPPPGDEARIEELLASLDEGIVTARGIKAKLDDDESVPPELLQTYGRIVASGNALAQAYGFQVCGRSA